MDHLVTSIITLFGGILIFVISQAILKLIIEPVQQLKSALGQLSDTLLRHQPRITISTPNSEIAASLREHAADITAKAAVISQYQRAARLFGLPSREDIAAAASALHRLAHAMRTKEDEQRDLDESRLVLSEAMTSPTELLRLVGQKLKIQTTWN
ncbi:hypothetical protein HU761_23490 [Pseudomonas sp. SWRI59]|uniref:hypothetical protein n=1 Tax=unclassified Pseudomonas TaxID=196821 RepID=UPI001646EC11|nr:MULTISPECIES: hypothetical protein [unclassified Pseudomonas]MBC3504351.1 hypothetical protein [Pseudomonas sp. SWRI59]MBC3509674.1 hypothetical protein [Pseudomonas sp. SWRI68]